MFFKILLAWEKEEEMSLKNATILQLFFKEIIFEIILFQNYFITPNFNWKYVIIAYFSEV